MLQLLQHLQTGLLKDERCYSEIHPCNRFPSVSAVPPTLHLNSRVQRRSSRAHFGVCLTDGSLFLQFDPDFQTPVILDESFSFSNPEESQFVGEFSDGLWAKSEPVLSMSAFQKPPQAALLGKYRLPPSRHIILEESLF